MAKVNSWDALKELRTKYRDNVIMRLVSDNAATRKEIYVSIGDCGFEKGARDILTAFFDEVNAQRLEDVSVIAADCFGECGEETYVKVTIPGKSELNYKNVDKGRVPEIVKEVANA